MSEFSIKNNLCYFNCYFMKNQVILVLLNI